MDSKPKPYVLPSDAVWLITGCSSGIGLGLAQFLATETSNRVVATARRPETLSDNLLPDGPNVLKVRLDVTSPSSIDAAFTSALARFGRVDVIVNNAGYTLMGDTEAAGDAESRALLDTNFWGAVDVTKRALPGLRGQGGGVVLFVSSFGGFCGAPGGAFYHASKFALEGFAESVRGELADPRWDVQVCCVEPGGVRTEYLGSSFRLMERRHPAYAHGGEQVPTNAMLRMMEDPKVREGFAEPVEVARAVWALVSSGRRLPVRLPVGRDSWAMVSMELDAVRGELEEWKEVSCGVGDERGLDMIAALKKI